jgi:hypothetical protein
MRQRGLRDHDLALVLDAATPLADDAWLVIDADADREIALRKREIEQFQRLRGCKVVVSGNAIVTVFLLIFLSMIGDPRRVWPSGKAGAVHVGAALDFAVHPLEGVGASDLGPVLAGKVHVGQHVVARGVHEGAELWLLLAQRIGDDAPLGFGVGLGLPRAKMVFSMAATAVRCFAGAWASAFLSQFARQRWCVALNMRRAAARSPL